MIALSVDNGLLVELSKQGDSCAFASLYAQYSVDLYRLALYMLGSKEDAEDAVQEAALSAWKNIASLRDDDSFKAWLFKILSNRCKTRLSEKLRSPDGLSIDGYDFLDEKGEGYGNIELHEAIEKLGPPDSQIILMSIVGGFKSHELAAIFQMPPATVRSRQKRALEKLRVELGGIV